MRAQEVAKYLKVHVNTVKKMPDLPYYILNTRGDRRYRRSEIDMWLISKRSQPE